MAIGSSEAEFEGAFWRCWDCGRAGLGLRDLARSVVLNSVAGLRLNELALRSASRGEPRIVVVAMHETLASNADQLRSQLDWVTRHFTIITPELFAKALETKSRVWAGTKSAVLFTFDDGRESNYRVAAPLLESYGARGIFFVPAKFIGLAGDAAKDFYYSRIDIRADTAPQAESDSGEDVIWRPMTPEQLADLGRRGHWIGAHTLLHTKLLNLSSQELDREINESARQIGLWTGKPVDAFAWAYSWDAIDRASWKAIRQVHRFCFSPCPGTVDPAKDSPFLIWRKEIESYYPPAEYRFMYSGLVDLVWTGKRRRLKKMLECAP
jgi:peptidoglycan/xylan/chitin deacetylase (PgdA/CDA1 family)